MEAAASMDAGSDLMDTDSNATFAMVSSHLNTTVTSNNMYQYIYNTYIRTTHALPRRGSRGISDVPPRRPRFTKIT
jgi:hypothetical protein